MQVIASIQYQLRVCMSVIEASHKAEEHPLSYGVGYKELESRIRERMAVVMPVVGRIFGTQIPEPDIIIVRNIPGGAYALLARASSNNLHAATILFSEKLLKDAEDIWLDELIAHELTHAHRFGSMLKAHDSKDAKLETHVAITSEAIADLIGIYVSREVRCQETGKASLARQLMSEFGGVASIKSPLREDIAAVLRIRGADNLYKLYAELGTTLDAIFLSKDEKNIMHKIKHNVQSSKATYPLGHILLARALDSAFNEQSIGSSEIFEFVKEVGSSPDAMMNYIDKSMPGKIESIVTELNDKAKKVERYSTITGIGNAGIIAAIALYFMEKLAEPEAVAAMLTFAAISASGMWMRRKVLMNLERD